MPPETVAQVLRRILDRQRHRPRRGPIEPDDAEEEAEDAASATTDTTEPSPPAPAPS